MTPQQQEMRIAVDGHETTLGEFIADNEGQIDEDTIETILTMLPGDVDVFAGDVGTAYEVKAL